MDCLQGKGQITHLLNRRTSKSAPKAESRSVSYRSLVVQPKADLFFDPEKGLAK